MKRVRKNLSRIEAMIIAVIMTVSMFGNVNVNAAEITNDNIISVTEQETVEEIAQTLDESVSLENGDVSEDVVNDAEDENAVTENLETVIAEEQSGTEDAVEEIDIIGTDEASEMTMMHFDEPEYLIQAGGFQILDEVLGANVAEVQDVIYQGLKRKADYINIYAYKVAIEDLEAVYYGVINEHPELYYAATGWDGGTSDGTYIRDIYPSYVSGVFDDDAFDRAVEKAMSVVNDGMSDLEKAVALHDYIAVNTKYNWTTGNGGYISSPHTIYTAYGVLVEQDAVCQGYALAYKLLLNKAGIESGVVISNAMHHEWNYIKLDGKYYYVDVTWDDSMWGFNNIAGFWDLAGSVLHENMFLSFDELRVNHRPTDSNHNYLNVAADWEITRNGMGASYIGLATSSDMDDFWWKTVKNPFVWAEGNNFYYIDSGILYKGDVAKSRRSTIGYLGNGNTKGLFEINGKIYFARSNGLYSMDTSGTITFVTLPESNISLNGCAKVYQPKEDKELVYMQSGSMVYDCTIGEILGQNEYTVTFVDSNGKELKKQVVIEGGSATAPDYETPAGYTASWSESFDDVRSNITVRLTLEPIKYTITYNLVKPGAVNGENPETYTIEDIVTLKAATCSGYIFNGWYPNETYSGATVSTISRRTGNIVLYAKWTPVKPTAPEIKAEPSAVLPTGNILVDAGTVVTIVGEEKTNVRYTTDGSNPTATSKIYTGGIVINEKTTINAICERDSVVSQVASKTFVIANNEFALQDDVALEAGETHQITAVTLPTSKAFTDISFSSSSNAVATVSDSGVITAIGDGTAIITATITDWRGRPLQDTLEVAVTKNYKVTFVGFDNNVIKEQVVRSGGSAQAPDMSSENLVPNGYEFKCWDKSFVGVTEDVTVYARFETKTYYIFFVNDEGENPPFKTYDIVSEDIVLPDSSEMTAENKNFVGWYDNEAYDGSPISKIPSGSTGDMVFYAKWVVKTTLTMEWDSSVHVEDGVAFLPYTGKAQTPAFTVYYGDTKLENKKDYTYKFANNVNAYILDENDESLYVKKAPVLIITGKGNYAGTERVYFNIERKRIDILDDSEIDIVPVSLAYNKKVQKVAPVVTWKGKKLTTKELTFEYDSVEDGAYINVGEYNVKVSGKGNYEGVQNVTLKIFNTSVTEENPSVLIKSCKVSITPFVFDENAIDFTDSEIRSHIKVTRGKNPVPYYNDPETDGNGYDIKLIGVPEAKDIGTYTVCISGKGIYKGELRTTFKINGLNVSTMKVTPIPAEIYDGAAKKPKFVIYAKTGEVLNELDDEGNGDYELVYQKNVDVGTATVVITGKNAYFGTRKVTFKINQKVMAADSVDWSKIKVTLLGTNDPEDVDCIEYDYVKGGVTPKLNVEYSYIDEFGNPAKKELMEKTDYTLAYKYNTSANPVVGKEPYVVLTLKKNIKGTMNIPFVISKKQLNGLTIKVSDIQANAQAGKYKSTPAIYDVNDKKLDSKDYETAFVYTYQGSDTPLDKYSKPEAGKVIKVTVTGKGNYTGSITGTYRVFAKGKSIASASIKVKPEVLADIKYNGQPVVLDELNDLEVKIGKTTVLRPGIDYKIDEKSYVNNVNKGTAKVTIVGNGEYAGSKTITFSIKPWYLTWWNKMLGI